MSLYDLNIEIFLIKWNDIKNVWAKIFQNVVYLEQIIQWIVEKVDWINVTKKLNKKFYERNFTIFYTSPFFKNFQ